MDSNPLSTAIAMRNDLHALERDGADGDRVDRLRRAAKRLLAQPLHEALVVAATVGDSGQTRKLLEAGATPDRTWTTSSTSPLVAAIMGRNEAAAVALVHYGANPDGLSGGVLPLRAAATMGMVAVVKALIDSGANVNSSAGAAKCTALYCAIGNWSDARVAELLLNRGARVDCGKYGPLPHPVVSPLSRAARDKNTDAAVLLIRHGAVAQTTAIDEVMYWACRNQMTQLIEALLLRGVSATTLVSGRTTALATAVRSFTGTSAEDWAGRVGVLFAAGAWQGVARARARFEDFKSAAKHAFSGYQYLASAIVSRGEMEAYSGGNGADIAARHGGACARVALDAYARRARAGTLDGYHWGSYAAASAKRTGDGADAGFIDFVISVLSGKARWSPKTHQAWAKRSPLFHRAVFAFIASLRRQAQELPALPDELSIEILRMVPFGALGPAPARGELLEM